MIGIASTRVNRSMKNHILHISKRANNVEHKPLPVFALDTNNRISLLSMKMLAFLSLSLLSNLHVIEGPVDLSKSLMESMSWCMRRSTSVIVANLPSRRPAVFTSWWLEFSSLEVVARSIVVQLHGAYFRPLECLPIAQKCKQRRLDVRYSSKHVLQLHCNGDQLDISDNRPGLSFPVI